MTTVAVDITRVLHIAQKDFSTASRARADWACRVLHHEGAGIVRLLWRLLGCEQDVMDALQDCFCRLSTCDCRGGSRQTRAYAYRTATSIAFDMLRARRRHEGHRASLVAYRECEQSGRLPADETAAEDLVRLRESIAQLPTHLRNVVVLRDLGEMSYAHVARVLGIEPATARVYRRHAVVKLAEMLGECNDRPK